jgi:hypothetical protein
MRLYFSHIEFVRAGGGVFIPLNPGICRRSLTIAGLHPI